MPTIEEIKKIKKGDILNTSWGYDMTINDYCVVMENTGKTIKCQKIGKKVTSQDQGMVERAMPDKYKKFCKPFRIKISKAKQDINNPKGNEAYLVGSYPFATRGKTSDCGSKRQGSWDKWEGKPDYENTYD